MKRALFLAALAAVALWGCQPAPAVETSGQGKPADVATSQSPSDPTQTQGAQTTGAQAQATQAATQAEPVKTGETPKEGETDSALPKSDKSLIPLVKDAATAMSQAKKEGKFVLMKFEAEWCGPCQLMKKEAFNDPSVAELLKDAVVVPIDLDDRATMALQKKYQVGSIPYLVFAEPDGKAFGAILGYESTDWLKRRITENLANRPGR